MASNGAGEEPIEAAQPPEAMAEVLRRLELLQNGSVDEALALLAQPETEAESPLQRRARAVRIELALRRQAVLLEEWQGRVRAAEAETERQRQLFSRLEAEFAQRAATLESNFTQAAAAETTLRAERDAALAQLKAVTDEKIEFERRAGDKARDFGMASELAEARRQLAETLERDLALTRQQLQDTHQFLTETRQELGRLQDDHRGSRASLAEAERRVEELRSSRWRRLGLRLGMAKRASFEK